MSDATKARIDELAAGWSIDGTAPSAESSLPHNGGVALESTPSPVRSETGGVSAPHSSRNPASPTGGAGIVVVSGGAGAGINSVRADSEPAVGFEVARSEVALEDLDATSRVKPEVAPEDPDATSRVEPAADLTRTDDNAQSLREPRRHALVRRPGLAGDLAYVVTSLLGRRSATQELRNLDGRQMLRQTSLDHHLTTLGRSAIAVDDDSHAAVRSAREAVQEIETERSMHVAAVRGAEVELERIRREREASIRAYRENLLTAEANLSAGTLQLSPLVAAAAAGNRRLVDLDEQARRIARKIAATEAKLVSESSKSDPVALRAEIAALKADRQAVQRDAPSLVAEIEVLSPQIAALRAELRATERQRRDLDAREAADHAKAAELLEAVGARRKVDERAATEAETARDKVLRELGYRLHAERSAVVDAQLVPIDQIRAEVAADDARRTQLQDILASFDRRKFARGVAMILVVVAAVATGVWLAA